MKTLRQLSKEETAKQRPVIEALRSYKSATLAMYHLEGKPLSVTYIAEEHLMNAERLLHRAFARYTHE